MEGRREPQDHTPFSEEGCRRGETGREAGRARTRDREGLCVEGKSVCGGRKDGTEDRRQAGWGGQGETGGKTLQIQVWAGRKLKEMPRFLLSS